MNKAAPVIRVLVVDSSAVVRKLLTDELTRERDIEVVTAVDPHDAHDKLLRYAPDVITLDVEMPRMDGLSYLARLMEHHSIPVIIVSALTPKNSEAALRALELGALDVIAKPSSLAAIPVAARQLLRAVRSAIDVNISRLGRDDGDGAENHFASDAYPDADYSGRHLIAIGASTGGPIAIEQVLAALPANAPGVVITQHMPVGFTAAFARRLNGRCAMTVREAADGDAVTPGAALIAPAGQHLMVLRSHSGFHVVVRSGPPVHYQRPSIDVLFHSIAQAAGRNAVGILLTGMGSDGASGMLAMRDAGAHTIAQDEATSVVFSMPGEAIRFGGACEVLSLPHIAPAALNATMQPHARLEVAHMR